MPCGLPTSRVRTLRQVDEPSSACSTARNRNPDSGSRVGPAIHSSFTIFLHEGQLEEHCEIRRRINAI